MPTENDFDGDSFGEPTVGPGPNYAQRCAEAQKLARSKEGPYKAPYFRFGGTLNGSVIVKFEFGYALQQHFDFLGRDFEVKRLDILPGYSARPDKELFRHIRYDPGIQFVEDNATVEIELD